MNNNVSYYIGASMAVSLLAGCESRSQDYYHPDRSAVAEDEYLARA